MKDIYVQTTSQGSVMYLQTPLKNVTRAELISASIPNTLFNITGGSCFQLDSNMYSISDGFYSASTLTTSVNQTMNTGPYTFSYLPGEGKCLFTNSSRFTLSNVSTSFGTVTGFFNGKTIISNLATSQNGWYWPGTSTIYFIKSPNISNFTSTPFVWLDINELRRPDEILAVSNTYGSINSTVFATIPLDTSFGSTKFFKSSTDYTSSVEYAKPIDLIDRLTVRWLDNTGSQLNFNGNVTTACIIRFFEKEPDSIILQSSTISDDIIKKPPTQKMVIVLLVISIVFILLIRHK